MEKASMGKREVVSTLITQTIKEFFDDRCSSLANSIAYYAFMSLFPLVILLVAVAGIFVDTGMVASLILNQVSQFIFPGSEEQNIIDIGSLSSTGVRGVAGVFGLLGLLWSASGMFGELRRTINEAWDIKKFRPIVRQKLMDFVLVLGLGFFILASVLSSAFISVIRNFDEDVLGYFGFLFNPPWGFIPLIVPGILSSVAFTFLYWFVPNTKVVFRHAVLGGLFAAFLFEITKNVFIMGVGAAVSGNAIYGSVGAIVGLLFWLRISSAIVLLGAEFTSEIPRVLRGDYRKEKREKQKLTRSEIYKLVLRAVKGLFVYQD